MTAEMRRAVEEFRVRAEGYVKSHGASGGLSLSSAQDVLQFVKEHGVKSIRVWFTDLLGFLKSFSITPAELEGAFEEGMGFDGSSIQGYKRINESDMVAFPIPETAQLVPFTIGGSPAIRLFARIANPDGSDYVGDPRNILKNQIERIGGYGFSHMNIGPEAEFFYFGSQNEPLLLDQAGYFDLNPVDAGDDLREATIFCLESMGITVEYSHHEVGPSQHEIDLKYAEAMTMADRLMTYKWLVKEVAQRVGVHATFMPKPLPMENGSGMHTHLSLFKDQSRNAFYAADEPYHLSSDARHFMAGILNHAREICLVTNQWHNSYKRLVPGCEAPVYIAWAERNRSALIRVPLYKPGKEVATRIELRFPDAACNPYIAFACMLSAGLHGLDVKEALPEQMTMDLYKLDDIEREQLDIRALPHDLYEAIQAARQSELLAETLGEDMKAKLIETKLSEYMRYRLAISQMELGDYMLL
jgi:glutamine synthetase